MDEYVECSECGKRTIYNPSLLERFGKDMSVFVCSSKCSTERLDKWKKKIIRETK